MKEKRKTKPVDCPICGKPFDQRKDGRPVTCSKSCARRMDHVKRGGVATTWKGGVNKHAAGYLKELCKGHPASDRNGYVMQHRLVMERMLGRYLEPCERVHHKNGKRDDNRPENLELWYLPSGARKDPPGQRFVDLIDLGLRNCPEEAKQVVRADLRAAFGIN